ncbi:MAG: hypothetical protein HW408_1733, partial [Actinobacteria bacterium]|nr:hypothetical protein [Actinomycetota bacterium]
MLGGWLVIGGRLTLGGFVAFNAYLAMLSFPTMALGWVINLVQRGGSAMGRINEFIRHPIESVVAESQEDDRASRVSKENGDASRSRHAPALEFKGLTYAYPGDGRGGVLRDITFSVRPGEVVGLVGPTGGGKSTLLSLILRLYPVPPGAVFFEGRDVNDIPVHLLRRSIAFVAQDPFLFSDTVLSNICFGFAAPDLEAARRAAGQARLLAEIEEMPDGFDTVIGERGISLSGGQKQRATIARALCTGARVLLMDDALSSVDAETEQEIFEEILALRGGRTILFSTHRMSSLSRCDRILVLSGGRIAEEGTHDELLSLRGEYFDLYSRQMLEQYFHEDRVDSQALDLRLLRRLLIYLRPHKGLIALALLGLALGTACQLAGPYLIKILIDRHITAGRLEGMAGWIGLYLASLAGATAFLYLQMLTVSVLGQRIILAIRKEMFSRLERLPVSFFDRTPTGRLMTRLTSDVEALQELISSGLVSTVGDVAVLLGIAAILLWMNSTLALVTFAVLPVLVIFVEVLKKFIREANREIRRMLARMNAFLQERVTGVAAVKAFVQEDKSVRQFDALNEDYAVENVRLTNYYSFYFPGVELFSSVAVALLLWQGGSQVISSAITFGTLVAFLEYAQKFFNPIKDMSDKYNILQSALASCERIFHILDAEPAPEYVSSLPAASTMAKAAVEGVVAAAGRTGEEGSADGATAPSPVPAIEFRDVWFTYAGGSGAESSRGRGPVLRGVSFEILEGEMGAIVGATGAGKTTILSLLCRLYEIERGRILLFGKDIRE